MHFVILILAFLFGWNVVPFCEKHFDSKRAAITAGCISTALVMLVLDYVN